MKKIVLIAALLIVTAAGTLWVKDTSSHFRAKSQSAETNSEKDGLPSDSRTASSQYDVQSDENDDHTSHTQHIPEGAIFGVSSPIALADIPAGKFRDRLLKLSSEAQAVALRQLTKLNIPSSDLSSMQVSSGGRIYYIQDIPAPGSPAADPNVANAAISQVSEQSQESAQVKDFESAASAIPPILHSKPGSSKIIFLDFDGATIPAGSIWAVDYNGGSEFTVLPYDSDGNTSLFSDVEQAIITRTWERVAEDFRPFDVDVTTEQPSSIGANVAHVVITRATRAGGTYNPEAENSGGVAFLDNFGSAYEAPYSPAFIYHNHVLEETGMAEAISHEAGHYIGGLRHDGGSGEEYYEGHGSGDTSWGPIMGAPYGKNVTQWSKGEYWGYSNPAAAQDDIAILAEKLAYAADDHGDTNATSTPISFSGNSISASGFIGSTGDADRFTFNTQAGDFNFRATPFRSSTSPNGGNLDLLIQLLDSSGNVIASANPTGETSASINATVNAGTYYVRISPVGAGSPGSNPPSGYTSYGSLGFYVLTGSYTAPPPPEAPTITSHPANITLPAGGSGYFSASVTSALTTTYRWQRLAVGGGIWTDLSDTETYTGTGNTTLLLNSVTIGMNSDQFRLRATNSAGVSYSNAATLSVNPALVGATPIIWGDNSYGQADVPAGLGSIIDIAGGPNFTLVLKSDGTVAGWGDNYRGSLNIPTNLTNVRQVAAGGAHGLALKTDGTVVAWGDLSFGNTGPAAQVPTGLDNVIFIAAGGSSSMALRSDGTVVVWGWGQSYTIPGNPNNIVQISSGSNHFLALKSDGTAITWGANFGEQNNVPSGLNGVIAIAAGDSHNLALRQDGTIVAWGYNNVGQCNVPAGLNSVVAIAAGGNFSMALKTDGSIVAWGDNSKGQGNVPAIAGGALKIAAGFYHGIALALATPPSISSHPVSLTVNEGDPANFFVTATGTAPLSYRWLHNGNVLSDGNGITGSRTTHLSIATTVMADGGNYTVVVENAGGSVVSNPAVLTVATPPPIAERPRSRIVHEGGDATFTITPVGSGPFTYEWRHNRQSIAAGTGASLTLNNLRWEDRGYYEVLVTGPDGGVAHSVFYLHVALPAANIVAWGNSPAQPPLITDSITDIAAGGSTYFAIKGDGTIVGWGANNYGQTTIPEELSDVVAVAPGGDYVVALRANGTVTTWGNASLAVATPPESLIDVVSVTAGPTHALALKSDGTLVGWGTSQYGQHSPPPNLDKVVAIQTGRFRSLALRSDGTLVEWGRILSGATTFPGPIGSVTAIANGESHAMALRSDGTVAAWGSDYANSTVVPPALSNVQSIAAGESVSAALKSDGNVVVWGRPYENQGVLPFGLANVVEIASAQWTVVAMTRATPPSIITHPNDTSVTMETPATFSISTSSLGATAYQWQILRAGENNWDNLSEGGIYSGTTGKTLTVSNTTISMNGDQYRCVIENAAGVITSNPALLTVTLALPVIIHHPVTQSVASGTSVTLYVSVTSATPVSYQWQKNGGDIPDATTESITFPQLNESNSGEYRVIVSNSYGEVTSQTATLTVEPLLITNYSGVATNADGSMVTLSVNLPAGGIYTYQWYVGYSGDTSNPVANGQNSSLTVPQGNGLDNYWVRVSNGTNSIDSEVMSLGKWTRINPLFGSAELSAVAYGSGKYVVVGESVGYSTNGTDWKNGNIEAGIDLRSVMYDGARFIAGGVRGQIFASSDGINWSKLRSADPGQYDSDLLTSVASGNGITVFAGVYQKLMSSTDGTNWNWRSVLYNGQSVITRAVAYGAGNFVVVGGNNTSGGGLQIIYSNDGVSWNAANFSPQSSGFGYQNNGLTQVYFHNGNFIALGDGYYTTSTDGINWTVPARTNAVINAEHMAQGDGLLFSADFRSSTDGINWTAADDDAPYTSHLSGLGYGNGRFIALKSSYSRGYASIMTSSNRTDWVVRVGSTIPQEIIYANDQFYSTGSDYYTASSDGVHWTATSDSSAQNRAGVLYANGLYVARSKDTSHTDVTHYTSVDGHTWIPHTLIFEGFNRNSSKFYHLSGRWLCVNGYRIFTAPDAINWTLRSQGSFTPRLIAEGNGLIAGIDAGKSIISTNGINWEEHPNNLVGNFRNIAFGSGIFVTHTTDSVWTSTDGLQWVQRQLPIKVGGNYSGYISGISYGAGRFIINYGNDILTSSDGTSWQLAPQALVNQVNGAYFTGSLLFANNTFWALDPSFSNASTWLRAPTDPSATAIVETSSDAIIVNGTGTTLNVSATGVALTYQWYKGITGDTSNPITGAITASYNTSALTETTYYWVRVSGPSGTQNSPTITVSIASAPVIDQHPKDVDVAASNTTVLSVVATATPVPTFQWYEGSSGDISNPIAGALGRSYTISSPTAVKSYWGRVTNPAGSSDSTSATVTPWFERNAITNKQLGGAAYGNGLWVVSGFGSNDYYSSDGANWTVTANRFGGQSPGEVAYGNGLFIAIDSDTPGALWTSNDGINWQKVILPGVSFQFGYVTHTGGMFFAMGNNGQFATSLDGTSWTLRSLGGIYTIQDAAYGNGIFILAAGSVIYRSTDLATWSSIPVVDTDTRITSVTFGKGMFIGVGGANKGKIMTSTDGISWSESYVYTDSNGLYDVAFNGSVFAVSATSHIILSRDGVNWHLAELSNTSQIAAGNSAFLAVGYFGAWQSAPDLRPLPLIVTQPVSHAARAGSSITLTIAVTSQSDISYQWMKNGTIIPNTNSPNYTIPSLQSNDTGFYSVNVTNDAGTVTSDTVAIVIAQQPTITTSPSSVIIYTGQSATFSVTATSNAPLSYQWRFEGEDIPGATSSSYTIPSAQTSDAGAYSVMVSTIAGSVPSTTATLTVLPASVPVITRQPASTSTPSSGLAEFSIDADGMPAPTYQWQRSANGTGPWTNLTESQPLTYSGVATSHLMLLNAATLNSNQGDTFRCIVTNAAGQVISSSATLTIASQAGPVRIAAGNNHLVFIDTLGNAWGSGRNQEGQLGDGSGQSRLSPQKGLPTFRTVAAGSEHTLFIDFYGTLKGAGYNEYGALGTGNYVNAGTPVDIASNASTASGGHRHSLFSKTDGTLWAMGWNQAGQLGDGTTTDRLSPVQVSDHVVVVAAGYSHSAFIKSDGTIWAMGANTYGQFGNGTTSPALSPIQVGTGGRAAAAGFYHTLFLKTDNSLWGAGYNGAGQLGDGTGTQRVSAVQIDNEVQAIAVGGVHSLYLKIDGTLWGMGDNSRGQLGTGDTTNRLSPVQIDTGVAGVGAGLYSSYYIKTDGSLWAMGANPQGQLGTADTTDRLVPTQVYTGAGSLPDSPILPSATELDNTDKVTLTWTGSYGTSHFEVWRHTSADRSSATRIANYITGNFFEDFTAAPGVTYYYWVDPINPYGRRTNPTYYATGRAGVASTLPYFTTHPQSQTVSVGDTVTFTAAIETSESLSIKWQKNDVDIPNSTNLEGTFTIDAATVDDAGEYRAVVVIPGYSGEDIRSEPATLTVNKAEQVINFAPLIDRAFTTTPIALSATASSGLPVTLSLVSGPATLTNDELTLTGTGTVTVRASQPGNASYSAATDVERSFTVSATNATINFSNLNTTYDGNPHAVTATTDPSGLTVNFTYDGEATAPTNAGSYAVVGTIEDENYVGSANDTLVIAKATQTISFDALADRAYTTSPLTLSATASSGLTVTFTVQSGPASLDGSQLTLAGTGSVTVRAAQAGNSNYLGASPVDRTFSVTANTSSWLADNFTLSELADESISGASADPDGDGLTNLLEYALGLDPKSTDTSGLPEVGTTSSDWTYTYTRPADRPDLTYEVEYSTDLATWSTAGISLTKTADNGSTQTWQATIPAASATNVFFRLKITQN